MQNLQLRVQNRIKMRKTNQRSQSKSKKNEKVRIAPGHQEKHDNTSMNYLIMTKEQLDKTKQQISNKYQELRTRIEEKGDPTDMRSDEIVRQLQEIVKQAKNYDFGELQKKIILALGKRLLHLEIELKKQEMQEKRIKKQKIEISFFRHKKIRKFKYEEEKLRKLKQNSYIIRPYSSGKGFIESEAFYRDEEEIHLQRLRESEYLRVAKQANKIYMNNYSHYSAQSNKSFQNGAVINMALVLCGIMLVIGVAMLSGQTIPHIEYYFVSVLLLIMLMLSALSLKTFIQKPNKNNQLEQTKCDVRAYFDRINAINRKRGKKFTWICPEDFMYLEVHFHDQQPQQ